MDTNNYLTTVMISSTTRDKLRQVAAANQRSMAAQLDTMIEKEFTLLVAAFQQIQVDQPETVVTGTA